MRKRRQPTVLEWTGERFLPEIHGQIELEHVHRYLLASQYVRGKVVLDIACGEGYGSAMLAGTARAVIGVDIAPDCIKHASSRYALDNLQFMEGSCAAIPLAKASVDAVVSFETIEHHDQHEEMMAEIKRVLRPRGLLIISSPDKHNYSDAPNYRNPFHVKELYKDEFKELLGRYFARTAYFGQRVAYGSLVFPESSASVVKSYSQVEGSVEGHSGLVDPIYWIALASDAALPKAISGVLEQPIDASEIVQSWRGQVAERDARISGLAQTVADREGAIRALTDDNVARGVWGLSLAEQLRDREAAIADRDRQIRILSDENVARGVWGKSLDSQLEEARLKIAERDGQIMERDASIADRDASIATLSLGVAERDVQILSLGQAVAERDQRIGQLSRTVAEYEAHISAIHRSKSWLITAPLRSLSLWSQRLRRAATLALPHPSDIVGKSLAALKIVWRRRSNLVRSLHCLVRLPNHAAVVDRSGFFDPDFYRAQELTVGTSKLRPLAHYLLSEPTEVGDPHPLFDPRYYLARYSDVSQSQLNPLVHFVLHGAHEGRDPSRWFDAAWYLAKNPDVATSSMDPLRHFLQNGAHEGRDPNGWFDTSYYVETNPDVGLSGMNALVHFIQHGISEGRNPSYLFDAKFFLAEVARSLGPSGPAVADLFTEGLSRGLSPHPLFDANYYQSTYPDVAESGTNPFLHFIGVGSKEGRNPSLYFDTRFYFEQNPDVEASGLNALEHYLRSGAAVGADPNPWFDAAFYGQTNPEVAATGINPLVHFVTVGSREGRSPSPLFDAAYYMSQVPSLGGRSQGPMEHFLGEGALRGFNPHPLFETKFYRTAYDDADESGCNPFLHFLRYGWKEGRKPNPLFDSRFYLDTYGDVAASGLNPLAHFVSHGASEWRDPHPLFHNGYYQHENADRIGDTNPLTHFLSQGRFEKRAPNPWRLNPVSLEIRDSLNKSELAVADASRTLRFAPRATPLVSILVPVFNHLPTTVNCLRALVDTTGAEAEIIVIDDCSTDGTAETLSKIDGLVYLRNETNLGFLRSCNRAAQEARGEYLVFLNNDTIPLDGWLDAMLAVFRRFPAAGLVGSKLLYPDGRLQEAGGLIWADGSGWNIGRGQEPERPEFCYVREVDYCSGASIMVSTELWRQLDGFDEAFVPAYYEDTDLCFRVRAAGRRVYFQPESRVVHLEGVSSGKSVNEGVKSHQARNQPVFLDRWRSVLAKHGNSSSVLPGFRDRYSKHQTLLVDACTPRPDHDAGSVDTFEYLRYLAENGHHVVFAPVADPRHDRRYTEELQRLGVECLYAPYVTSVEEYLAAEGARFDLVLLFRVAVAASLIDAVRKYSPRARVVFATVDLHSLREGREAEINRDPDAQKRALELRDIELSLMSRADNSIVWSQYELEMIQKERPSAKVTWVRSGRSIPTRAKQTFKDRRDFVFVGGFRHTPNIDAVRFFVQEIWPFIRRDLPDCRFLIAGSNCDTTPAVVELASDHIQVLGFVPDIEGIFDPVRVSVAPIRYGAGMKGKVLSSLSHGVPVVGTPLAFEGMALTEKEGVLEASDPREMADLAIRLHTDEAYWTAMSDAGVAAVRRLYSPDVFRRHVGEALQQAGFGTNAK